MYAQLDAFLDLGQVLDRVVDIKDCGWYISTYATDPWEEAADVQALQRTRMDVGDG